MNKKYLFNRSIFAKAKGHDVKRKSSKGLVTGIVLAGSFILLGAGQVVSADQVSESENNTASTAVVNTDTADTQTVDSTNQTAPQTSSAEDSSENASEASSNDTDNQANNVTSDEESKSDSTQTESVTTFASVRHHDDEDEDEDDEDEEDEDEDEDDEDEDEDNKKSNITFNDQGVNTSSSHVNVDGKNITLTSAGTYTLSGSADGYHITVADDVTGEVKLKLKAVNLTESNITTSKNLAIKILADSSISSSSTTLETGGALFISSEKRNTLKVSTTSGHAIKANSLEADEVTLDLSSTDKDGIHAKTSVTIKESNVTISATDDGIQAQDDTDVNAGDITIKDSNITITSTSKGITANDEVTVKGSTSITITSGSEGIEGRYVNLKKGDITINANDDMINATEWTTKDDADLSHLTNSTNDIKNKVAIVISGANVSGTGYDDGLDSNGDLTITGGSLKIQSVTDYSSAIDYDGTGLASGGTVWGIGHMGFAQGFSTGTKQAYIIGIASGLAGDTITITDEKGRVVAETKADVAFDSVVFSSKKIKAGKTYTITTSDGRTATVTATKETTPHPKTRRHIPKETVPLLPNGHHPAFPGNGTPPTDSNS
ncbi:carbohydrate-binding domain-containing protein [Streptococcus dentiloxodontae]